MGMDTPTKMVSLSEADCIRLIGTHSVGRICAVDNGFPIAVPINYRMIFTAGDTMSVIMRVRRDGLVDQPGCAASLEIDDIDHGLQIGWSVVARGVLHRVDDHNSPPWLAQWDPRPWVVERDTWIYLEVTALSGRELIESNTAWSFEVRGYL
jgi:Pyridoxamine 5'-phosphate oxidase